MDSRAKYLCDLLIAPTRWQLIEFGLTVKLFDHLQAPVAVKALSATLNMDEQRLTMVLNALVSMGILQKQQDVYRLPTFYQAYLVSTDRQYLGKTLLHLAKTKAIDSQRLQYLLASSGKGAPQLTQMKNMRESEFWLRALDSLSDFHRSVRNPTIMPYLRALPVLESAAGMSDDTTESDEHKIEMLDLGAGACDLAAELVAAFPSLSVTLFDLPPCSQAQAHQRETYPAALQARIHLQAGDMNDAVWPALHYDLIFASMSLYFASDLPQLLQRLHQAMKPDSVLVSFHEGLTGEGTQPEAHVVGRLGLELQNGAMSFAKGEIEAALAAAGFEQVTVEEIDYPFGPMQWICAKKPRA
ncbi:class I SAM-dependent methyltransferase [Thaumasiovibrio subtropicus]|uniref:class I SAM-dependent methyltransferase n=1 Tax=Thaumasiovibrio subtropicus TaxID=1891207 RepID=UPI000B359113|nr:class I SAM-dependent methyltransferase [Thaumasiovibrio subtropicus]